MSISFPKNTPGPFYVENQFCISCHAPYSEAPDLMAHDDGEGGYHCHFKRQPRTAAEVEQAAMACVVSCVRAVRYAGNDPAILKRFRELRSEDSCSVLTNPLAKFDDASHPPWDPDVDG